MKTTETEDRIHEIGQEIEKLRIERAALKDALKRKPKEPHPRAFQPVSVDLKDAPPFDYKRLFDRVAGANLSGEITDERIAMLRESLTQLPDRLVWVVGLRYRGWTLRAISLLVGRSPSVAQQAEQNAIRLLRRLLKSKGAFG